MEGRRFPAVPAIIIIALAVLSVHPGLSRAQERPAYPFGLGVYLHRVADDPALLIRVADLAAGTGAGWTREEFAWSLLEPAKGEYDQERLAQMDRVVEQASARGLAVLGLISGPSAWSGGAAPASRAEYRQFAEFAAYLARRYQGRVSHWEIWNEPNTARFWAPEPDPAAYCALLKEVYPALKKAAPSARVVAGALSDPQDLVYLFTLMAHGATAYMDILSVHPYTAPDPLENSREETNLRLMGQLTAQFGEEKPVWITELGFPTCQGLKGVSEERQAQLLVRAHLAALAAGARVVQWYDFRDDGTDPADCEQSFGLITHQEAGEPLAPKPAYQAFGAMTALLGQSQFLRELNLGYDFRGVLFRERTTDQKTLALWLVDQTGEDRQVELSLGLRGSVGSVLDIFGQEAPFVHDGDVLSLTLSGSPLYVRGEFETD